MRCWECGAEPLEVVDASTFSDPQPVYLPGRWPPGDHEHAVNPPTPEELARSGHRALRRILEDL